MRCGRSVADPPDDPVVVEAFREVAERLVGLLDGPESVQPEKLLLQGADESLSLETLGIRCPRAGGRRTGSTRFRGLSTSGLELVLEGVRDELAAVVVAELRARRDVDLVPALREVDRLAQALDCLQVRASNRVPRRAARIPRHSPVQWSTTTR